MACSDLERILSARSIGLKTSPCPSVSVKLHLRENASLVYGHNLWCALYFIFSTSGIRSNDETHWECKTGSTVNICTNTHQEDSIIDKTRTMDDLNACVH